MDALRKKTYKYCVVPLCKSTTISTPNKLFFLVPRNSAIRRKWCRVMKRDLKQNAPLSEKTPLYCCEDHFVLENDTVNFMEYKIMSEQGQNISLQLRKGISPHLFHCQKEVKPEIERKGLIKRRRIEMVKDILMSHDAMHQTQPLEPKPEPSTVVDPFVECDPGTSGIDIHPENEAIEIPLETLNQTSEPSCDITYTHETKVDKGIQVNIRATFRSKGVNTRYKKINIGLSPIVLRPSVNASTSPFKVESTKRKLFVETLSNTTSLSVVSKSSSTVEMIESGSSSEISWIEEDTEKAFKERMRSGILWAIEKESKLLLGLPKKSYYLIKLLSENVPAPTIDILITLKKIKLNDSFSVLGLHFGFSQSTISKIFKKTVLLLAGILKELIIWPDRARVMLHLPIPFRARYSNVVSIIDCLEIEIEKPTNAVHQALSWSQYKGCNTLKYLISCTPDGLITYISEGYGGRASDVAIVEDSGYLDKLPSNVAVMADRGFKNISHMLEQQNCLLIRPPSVSKLQSSSKDEVKQSKQIAALRIHVERVIGRLREFNMLLPHSRVDNNFISTMDYILIIACAIVNMQDYLIKNQI